MCQMAIETLTDWHRKFVHQNYEYVRKFLTRENIKFKYEDPRPICKECLVGKQHRSSYPKNKSRVSTQRVL